MDTTEIKDNYNYGLALLKILMCFEVVLCHFWKTNNDVPLLLMPFYLLLVYSVPVFMLISFLFLSKSLVETSTFNIKQRLWKLFYPLLGWAVIYWVSYSVLDLVFRTNLVNGVSPLLWQIATGHSSQLNPAMWFQTVLILLTILFYLIATKISNRCIIICAMAFLIIGSLFLQYSGINYSLFGWMRFELKYPLGRFFEMIPYAAISFLAIFFGWLNYGMNHKALMMIASIVFGAIVFFFLRPIIIFPYGFGYQGISLILMSVCVVVFSYYLPISNLGTGAKNFIKTMAKFTLGIYCSHNFVGRILKLLFTKMNIQFICDSFLFSVIIFVLCFAMCAILYSIPIKGKSLKSLVS